MKKTLSEIISDWVMKNKSAFWKYEIAYFYRTYKITVRNLPKPEKEDIVIMPNIRSLKDSQRTQLCSAISKACAKAGASGFSTLDVEIGYADEAVVVEVI